MNNSIIFAKLRNALAILYPDENSSRRIVDDAEINPLNIEFTGRAKNNWHNILLEAKKTNSVDTLLKIARDEYSDDEVLHEACDAYYNFSKYNEQIEPVNGSVSLTYRKRSNSHVFICYSRRDQDFVIELANQLQKRDIKVWTYQWSIPPGADWNDAIEKAIHDCKYFLIILSPAMVASREAKADLQVAWTQKKSIVPVFYQSCNIPRQVQPYQYIDFRQRNVNDSETLERLVNVLSVPLTNISRPIVTVEEISSSKPEKETGVVWLHFSNLVTPRVKATIWHQDQLITDREDGSCDFKVPITEWKDMALWVRGWGANVEVLKPEALRKQLRNEAKWLAQLYENKSKI